MVTLMAKDMGQDNTPTSGFTPSLSDKPVYKMMALSKGAFSSLLPGHGCHDWQQVRFLSSAESH